MISTAVPTETNLTGTLTSGLTSTGLSATVTFRDSRTGQAREPQSTTLLFTIDKDTEDAETILCTSHSTTSGVTTLVIAADGRGMPKYGAGVGSGTGSSHTAGAEVGCVNVAYPINALNESGVAKAGDTMTGPLGFSGSTNEGLTVANLTTTERDALASPSNGLIIYNTTAGEFQIYQGGAWSTVSSGSTQPNASETVAGKIELATNTEMGTGTSTGGTGARLVPPNDQLVKTSAGAGDANKIAVLDSTGKFAGGFLRFLDVQTFTSGTSNWTKPTAVAPALVLVLAIGAGGGGGGGQGGSAGAARVGGSGGGGGSFVSKTFNASDLAATVSVTVGAGGTSGAGGSAGSGSDGGNGNNTTFGTHLTAYGGGGGLGGTGSAVVGGGGGGVGGKAALGTGGIPTWATDNIAIGGTGGSGQTGSIGCRNAEYGGATGGSGPASGGAGSTIGVFGGSSLFGGAGGGSGGSIGTGNAEVAGGNGGTVNVMTQGGGATGGLADGGLGGSGVAVGANLGGSGAGGGGAQASGTGGAGGVGGVGAGGGGGGGGTTVGGAGGVGGVGKVIVYSFL